MKFYKIELNGKQVWGIGEGDDISVVEGDIFSDYKKTGQKVKKFDAKILAPLINSYILAVGANYLEHIKESNSTAEEPEDPVLFIKLPTAVIANDDTIELPENIGRIDYEAEIAAMVDKDLYDADIETVKESVFGITCLNDVSARAIQEQDGQWIRAKNFKTFCPLGPCIETEIDDLDDLSIESRLNGEVKQKSNSKMMIFKIAELISFISKHIPLKKGDIITTGTPEGVGPLTSGDTIEVDIKGVGVLRNNVK